MAKMFCKMCFDSGKSETEYTSHWIKDAPNGKVVCPTLLNHVCGYCKQKGHTPKHCERLASRNDRRKIHDSRLRRRAQQTLGGRFGKVQQQIRTKDQAAAEVKAGEEHYADNPYAALMRTAYFKPPAQPPQAPRAPKVVAPRAPQGAWGKVAKVGKIAKNMTAEEVTDLKELFRDMGIMGGAPTSEEQVWLEKQIAPQTIEETADGEAFFDNDLDAEEAVTQIVNFEQPPLLRQGAFGYSTGFEAKMLPEAVIASQWLATCSGTALPEACNFDDLDGEAGVWAQ
jgi:hypothetical protein